MDILGRITMVKTGYIAFITEAGGGQDANGNPIAADKVPSVFVECNLKVAKKEYKVWVEGQWRDAKYSVYVDNCLIPDGVDITKITEVQLQDNRQLDLGVHQIHNMEYLELMNQTKIVV
jgi:hypothetical protein